MISEKNIGLLNEALTVFNHIPEKAITEILMFLLSIEKENSLIKNIDNNNENTSVKGKKELKIFY